MYKHIKKAVYISQKVDKEKFNDMLRFRVTELYFDPDQEPLVNRENEFIRILHEDMYIDFAIRKVIYNQFFTIKLGHIIDTNKTTRENEKH